jgi:hypothetical protein
VLVSYCPVFFLFTFPVFFRIFFLHFVCFLFVALTIISRA